MTVFALGVAIGSLVGWRALKTPLEGRGVRSGLAARRPSSEKVWALVDLSTQRARAAIGELFAQRMRAAA